MASGATGPESMAIVPVAGGMAAPASPPAKRYREAATNQKEQELTDTLEDHAARLDKHYASLKNISSALEWHLPRLDKMDEKGGDLRQRLQVLEAQVVRNENTLNTVGQDVLANDNELKDKLKTLEQQLHATAGAAQAASQAPGPLAGDAVALAELAARLEQAETHINKVEGMARDIAVDHNKKGDMLHGQMAAGFEDIKQRMARLEVKSWTPLVAPVGASNDASGPATAPSTQAGSFPQFDAGQRVAAAPQMYTIGDYKKQIFEDKVAIAGNMQYTEDGKRTWLETTRNYLISKAFEMNAFLKWAESAQAATITDENIAALSSSGMCMDHEPMHLSRALWGYLNLSLTGSAKMAFKNVEVGNGFDAWRRVAVPIIPRSEARLHSMHNGIHSPAQSRRLADVMMNIDTWESHLREYYECGGDAIPDKTKIVIAMGMLPPTAPASLRRALRGITEFDAFKHELRGEIKFLEDYGGLPGGGANVLHDDRSTSSGSPSDDGESPPELRSAGGSGDATERDIPQFLAAQMTQEEKDDYVLAINIRRGNRQQRPPRDKQQQQQVEGCYTAQGRSRCEVCKLWADRAHREVVPQTNVADGGTQMSHVQQAWAHCSQMPRQEQDECGRSVVCAGT